MTPREQHLARIRQFNQRLMACEEASNVDGAQKIQNLIDAENNRWESSATEQSN